MATRLDISSAASFDYEDADTTIEMELTPEQMLVLTQAAAVSAPSLARPAPPVPAPPVPVAPVPVPLVPAPLIVVRRVEPRAPVKRRVGVRLAIALGIAGAAVVLSGVAYVLGKRSAPVQIVTVSPPPPPARAVEPQVPELPVVQLEPVRFTNPFDRTEVFEFPPGTSRDEARDAVAQLLLERARERQRENQNPNSIEQPSTNQLVQRR